MTVYHDMSSSYIKLEKEYYKKASKIIQYEMNKYLAANPDTKEINLSTAQHVMARGLGFRNTDGALSAFDKKQPIQKQHSSLGILQFWSSEKIISLFHFLLELNNKSDENRYSDKAKMLVTNLLHVLIHMRDEQEILLDAQVIVEYLQLDNLIKTYKTRRDFPSTIRHELWTYLKSLPGMGSDFVGLENNNPVKEHHQRIVMELLYPISIVSQLEKYDALIISPQWYHAKHNNYHVANSDNQEIVYSEHHERVNNDVLKNLYEQFTIKQWNSFFDDEFGRLEIEDYEIFDRTTNRHLFKGFSLINPIAHAPWLEDTWLVDRQYNKIFKGLLRTKQLQSFNLSDLMLYTFEIVNTQKRELHLKFIKALLNNYDSVIKQSQQLCSI